MATFYVFVVSPPAPQSTTLYMSTCTSLRKNIDQFPQIALDHTPQSTRTRARRIRVSRSVGTHGMHLECTVHAIHRHTTGDRTQKREGGDTHRQSPSARREGEANVARGRRRLISGYKATERRQGRQKQNCGQHVHAYSSTLPGSMVYIVSLRNC